MLILSLCLMRLRDDTIGDLFGRPAPPMSMALCNLNTSSVTLSADDSFLTVLKVL